MKPTPLDRLARGSRVLLIRLRSLGDCVLTTPAIHLLKSFRPDLEIGVVAEERFRGVFEGNPDVAAIVGPNQRQAFRFRPALAVNLHGGSRGVALTLASMARWRAGYAHLPCQWAYNIAVPRAQEILGEERVVHTAEHAASVMFYLGVPKSAVPRARLYAGKPPEGGYAVIHPFASAAPKAWPAERFAELARRIEDEQGLRVAVVGGREDDFSAFERFETLRGAPLGEVKSLLSGARLFVGNDSGPAHMAAAFGVPVVVLYGASDPLIWAPWRTRAEVIHRPEGLSALAVEEALSAVRRLLEEA